MVPIKMGLSMKDKNPNPKGKLFITVKLFLKCLVWEINGIFIFPQTQESPTILKNSQNLYGKIFVVFYFTYHM